MAEENASEHQAIIREIIAVLQRCGESLVSADASAESVAEQWLDADFDDAEEVEDWLRARCFSATGAQALEQAGITPEQAKTLTTAGSADYEDSLGYKVTHGDLSIDEARRIITNDFWNS